MQPATLIRTKLHRPPIPREWVERLRLVEMLNRGLERKLMLVSAPAGYGKSTAVSAWVETSDFPTAWLSLDEYDDDLTTFGAYLAEAVCAAYPGACQTFSSLLNVSTLPPPHRLADALLSDLEALPGPLVLALDDYHTIQSNDVHAFMKRMVHRLPAFIQLVVITRQDPPLSLPKLRAHRQLLEISGDDLQFTAEESRALLERIAGEPIGDEIATILNERTEGWPVGLQLAGIALRESRDPAAFARQFAQILHHQVIEYLLNEVLHELTVVERTAAVQLSIVERFCAGLCEAIIELPGSDCLDGEAFIRKLTQANLFTIPLDDEGVWYRYHHLFKDMLQQRLQRMYTDEAIARIHMRASAWFADHDLIDEAIDHALAGGNVTAAVELVEAHRITLLNSDQWRILEKWLNKLPDDVKTERPQLSLAQAWVFNTRFVIWAIPPIINRLAPLLADVESAPAVQGEINYFMGVLQYWQGQGERSLASLERALNLLPQNYSQNRGEAWFYWGLSAQQTGRGDEAVGALNQILADILTHQGERSDALIARLVGTRTAVHLISAQLFEANQPLQQIRTLADRSDNIYINVWSLYTLGNIHFGWHDLEKAATYFEQAAENLYANHTRAAIDNLAGLALTWQALGESEKAGDVLEQLYEFVAEIHTFAYEGVARSCEARLALLRGDLDAAVRWQKGADLTSDAGLMFFWLETPRITQCRVLVAEGSAASLAEVDDKLRQYIYENEALNNAYQLIQLLPLQAQLQQKLGRTDEALATLRRAATLAEPGGWIQPFVEAGAELQLLLQMLVEQGVASDYVRRLLTSVQASGTVPSSLSHSTPFQSLNLTNRELDVLELLAQRLSNHEIAEKLVLSPQTIKNYSFRLYQKLHVHNRRQAVAKARSLGILRDSD